MRDEIEDLHTLADECREWSRIYGVDQPAAADVHRAMVNAFKRLADKLDAIAKRIGGANKAAEAILVEVQEKCARLTKRLQERREVTLVGSGTDDAERAYEVGFRDARTIAELMVRNAAQSSLATDVGKIPLPPRGSRDNDH